MSNPGFQPRDARHKVWDKVAFIPACFARIEKDDIPVLLHGRVIYVNEEHRYFVAEAPCNGYAIREAFKF